MVIDQVLGPPGQVANSGLVCINAQLPIEGCQHFSKVNWPIDNLTPKAICMPDSLARLQAAAGQQSATDLRPMVAASVLVNDRSSPKFAPGDNRHILLEAPMVQVFDEGAHA